MFVRVSVRKYGCMVEDNDHLYRSGDVGQLFTIAGVEYVWIIKYVFVRSENKNALQG